MKTFKTKRTRSQQPIRKETLQKVCNALVEISYLNVHDEVPSHQILDICSKYKVQLLMMSLRELGFIKKVGFKYQVLFKREVCNDKMAINLYRFYRNFTNRRRANAESNNESVEQLSVEELPIVQANVVVEKHQERFAVFAQQDVEKLMQSVIMYDSLDDLKNNPPTHFGKYSILSIGRSFEVKPQVILD